MRMDLLTLCRIKLLSSELPLVFCKRLCSAKASNVTIKIPKRIERGPVDILKALAETVKTDPTASHYKFPDDPFFETKSGIVKRTLALSLESGRKSARWIFENNPEFFQEKISAPFIKSFGPKITYNENSDIGEDTLLKVILEKNVDDAIIVYNLLSTKNIAVSENIKQMLLELVCFYNCEKPFNEDEPEKKWYKLPEKHQQSCTWKDNDFAEKLFESMSPDSGLAYSAIIQGMFKYGQIQKAYELFETAIQKNLPLTVGVFNSIFSNMKYIREYAGWSFIEEILGLMVSRKVKPNLYTLCALLDTMFQLNAIRNKEHLAMALVEEFSKLNVQPSLGVYLYLIKLNSKARDGSAKKSVSFLKNVLRKIENENLEISHPLDFQFFSRVMKFCSFHLKNAECARMLHNIFMKDNNVKFISGNFELNVYYFEYLNIMFSMEPIEDAMEEFQKLVPQSYIPDAVLFQEILKRIDDNEAYNHLIPVWDVLKYQPYHYKRVIFPKVVSMGRNYNVDPNYPDATNTDISSVFLDVAQILFENMTLLKPKEKIECNDKDISNIMIVFSKFGKIKDVLSFGKFIDESQGLHKFDETALNIFFKASLSEGLHPQAKNCIKVAEKWEHRNLSQMAHEMLEKVPDLNEVDKNWLTKLASDAKDTK